MCLLFAQLIVHDTPFGFSSCKSPHSDSATTAREQDIRSLRQEIEILRGLKHEHIIEMSDAFETKSEFCVVTEFAQGELFEARAPRAPRPLEPPRFRQKPPGAARASFVLEEGSCASGAPTGA